MERRIERVAKNVKSVRFNIFSVLSLIIWNDEVNSVQVAVNEHCRGIDAFMEQVWEFLKDKEKERTTRLSWKIVRIYL